MINRSDVGQDDVNKLAHNIVAGLSPRGAIEYADAKRISARATEQRCLNREAAERTQVEQKEARIAEAQVAFGQEIRDPF